MNTTPTSSHPDVVDATHVLRGLVQLALRRVIQGPGSAEAVALLNDVERGAKSLFCTVDIKSVNAQLHRKHVRVEVQSGGVLAEVEQMLEEIGYPAA